MLPGPLCYIGGPLEDEQPAKSTPTTVMAIGNLLVSLNDKIQENKGQYLLLTLPIDPLIYIFINELVRHNARISNLQGPPGPPLIGNIWDIHINAAEKYREWSKKYGKVYQIQLGNISIVVVNSASAARTIFEANAQALSSRLEFYTFHKVCTQSQILPKQFVNPMPDSLRHGWYHDRHFSL